MINKVIKSEGISGITVQLSIFEAQALQDLLSLMVKTVIRDEDRYNTGRSDDLLRGHIVTSFRSMKTSECEIVISGINKIDNFVAKITTAIPAKYEVEEELFGPIKAENEL